MLAAVALLLQTNLGFEFGSRRWGGGGEGYELDVDRAVHREGRASGRIRFTGTEPTGGVWTQCFEADDYRGYRLRLTGYIRTEGVTEGWAGLWMRVDGPDGVLAFDNMAGRGLSGSNDWTCCRVTLDVPPEAEQICLGMLLAGNGTAWVDELSLAPVEPPAPDPYADSAEPLSDRGLANLSALARVWGLARYFQPRAHMGSEEYLVELLPRIEGAEDLVAALREVYGDATINPERPEPRDPPEARAEVLRSRFLYIVPGGDLPDLADARAVILDLRGGVDLPEALLRRLLARPSRYPDVRTVRHFGFAQGEHPLYRLDFPVQAGEPIEPDGAGRDLRVMILTDGHTRPLVAGRILTLVDAGQGWTVGEEFPAWAVEPYEEEVAPGIRVAIHTMRIEKAVPLHHPCTSEEALDRALEILDPPDAIGTGGGAGGRFGGRSPPRELEWTPRMRQVRLADVIILWNILRHFYPYWDVVETDWDAALGTCLSRAATDAEPARFADTMNELLALAHDGHGWLAVQEATAPVAAPDLALAWVEERVVIAAAAGAGFERGMEVVEIDGRPAWMALDETMRRESGATPQFRRFRALSRLLAGPPGSEVELAVRPPDGEVRRLRARRNPNADALSDLPPHAVHETVDGDILYINLSGIDDEGFRALLDEAVAAAGVIFDLRGYPGNVSTLPIQHLIDRVVRSPHMDVPILTHPDRATIRWTAGGWPVEPEEPRIPGPVVFLTDGRAISYAETYLAIIQNNRIATILGEPTAGTNGNVTSASLPGGVTFSFTGMRVTNLDGSRHHGVGVPPDIEVHRTIAGVREGRDEFVEAAVRVIRERRR